MKKTMLALSVSLFSLSAYADVSLTCPGADSIDEVYDLAACTEVTSDYAKAYAQAKEGDVITIKNGMPVPVTPKTRVVAMLTSINFESCAVGTNCEFEGFGFSSIHKNGKGSYSFNLESEIKGGQYHVSDMICNSTTGNVVSGSKAHTSTGFEILSRFTKPTKSVFEALDPWSICNSTLTVTELVK
tara:strand:- start:2385 stop:2942 length:558 start_codon:yes stop_codon:yes gene_type:complete